MRLVLFIASLAICLSSYAAAEATKIDKERGTRSLSEHAAQTKLAAIISLLDEAKKSRQQFVDQRAQLNAPFDPKTLDIDQLRSLGDLAHKVGAFSRAAEINQAIIDRGGMRDRVAASFSLGLIELARDDVFVAVRQLEQAAEAIPSWSSISMEANGALAHIYLLTGQIEKSEEAIERIEKTLGWIRNLPYWNWWQTLFLSMYYRNHGFHAWMKGNLDQAEKELREAVTNFELDQPLRAKYMKELDGYRRAAEPYEDLYQYGGAMAHAWFGMALAAKGKTAEGEFHVAKALTGSLRRTGLYSPPTAGFIVMLANILVEQGRYDDANRLLGYASDVAVALQMDTESVVGKTTRLARAQAFFGLDRYVEARDLLLQAERESNKTANGGDQHSTNRSANKPFPDLYYALLMSGSNQDLVSRLQTDLPFYEARLPTEHPFVASLHVMNGIALVRIGQKRSEGLREAKLAMSVLIEKGGTAVSPARQKVLTSLLEAYAGLVVESGPVTGEQAEDIFRMTDLLRNQGAQRALRSAAARAKVPDPQLATMIRQQQDLENEAEALSKIVMDLSMRPADKQLPAVLASMQARLKHIGEESTKNSQTIDQRFPSYAQLMSPRTPGFAELKNQLVPGEIFVSMLPMKERTFVWAISKDREPAMHVSRLGGKEIAGMVGKLRRAFGFEDGVGPPPYDFGTALTLYRELLEPLSGQWEKGSLLTVAAGGALSQLPLGTLITKPFVSDPKAKVMYGGYASAPWLIRRIPVAEIPSASALVTLRQLPAGKPDRKILIGYGDPEFSISSSAQPKVAGYARNLGIAKAVSIAPEATSVTAADEVSRVDYGVIPPLPDTRDELLSIAQAVGASSDGDLFLGKAASRDAVMKEDLSRRRIVAFATHGVLPGEFPGLDQPALAMANPGGGKTGFLTAADVMSLKLDADWIVLSACNTATSDGHGADALSGLGRSFFFAGGRALLATHWAVESSSARQLVSGLFQRYAKSPELSRARALQQSIMDLIDAPPVNGGNLSLAHPAFWAPYALIGDGATH